MTLFIFCLLVSCASKKKKTDWNEIHKAQDHMEEDLDKETRK